MKFDIKKTIFDIKKTILECQELPNTNFDIQKIAEDLYRKRLEIIDLFCKTFIVSQEVKSAEELRALFEICELTITRNKDLSESYRVTLRKNNWDQ